MRIVSLFPGATELLWALGLGDQVVGVSEACDFPPEARTRRVVVRVLLDGELPSAQIDRIVASSLATGQPLYAVDLEALAALDPDLVVAQGTCAVCAASEGHPVDLRTVVPRARVLSLQATSLRGVLEDLRRLAKAVGVAERGEQLAQALEAEISAVAARVQGLPRPRVVGVEWLDPPFTAGHWLPEIVHLAGGQEVLGKAGQPSRRTSWEEIASLDPDVVLLAPCGFSVTTTLRRLGELAPEFWQLRAVREGRAYVLDAHAYTSRPGPRLVEGLRRIAALLHPDRFEASGSSGVQLFPRVVPA